MADALTQALVREGLTPFAIARVRAALAPRAAEAREDVLELVRVRLTARFHEQSLHDPERRRGGSRGDNLLTDDELRAIDMISSELHDLRAVLAAAGQERREDEALDALEDMWWQFAHEAGDDNQWRHDGGLSALELATDVLERAGRIERVRPDKDLYRLVPRPAERPAEREGAKNG